MTANLKKLASIRDEIAKIEQQQEDQSHYGLSRAEVEQRFAAEIDVAQERARVNLRRGIRQIADGESGFRLGLHDSALTVSPRQAVENLRDHMLLFVGKEAALAQMRPLFEELPKGTDSATRAKNRSESKHRFADLEALEETMLRALDEEGVDWIPRPGQRPHAAILISVEE